MGTPYYMAPEQVLGEDVTIHVRVRQPARANFGGRSTRVHHLDLISGDILGSVKDRATIENLDFRVEHVKDKVNTSIPLPEYVKDVAKVQIGFTPRVSAVVGDGALGAAAPGTSVTGSSFTWMVKGIF